jgi:hypothetical protein
LSGSEGYKGDGGELDSSIQKSPHQEQKPYPLWKMSDNMNVLAVESIIGVMIRSHQIYESPSSSVITVGIVILLCQHALSRAVERRRPRVNNDMDCMY